MSTVDLPKPTKHRLIQLMQILKSWPNNRITSVAISDITGWKSSLIRHDLWLVGFNQGVSNGYSVTELNKSITDALGMETLGPQQSNISNDAATTNDSCSAQVLPKNICIAGLGRLGAALLDESLVDDSCFHIKAGFDSNVNRVEILRSTFPLYPASEMDFVIKKEKISYAILAVADKDGQPMTNRLVKAGITGIINMTNVILKVPEGVKVENLSILNALKMVI